MSNYSVLLDQLSMELLLGEIIGFLFLSMTISVWFLLASTSLHEEFVLFGSHFMSALLDLVFVFRLSAWSSMIISADSDVDNNTILL